MSAAIDTKTGRHTMKTLKPIPGFSKYGITQCARLFNLRTKRTTIESCSGNILAQVVSSATMMTLATPYTKLSKVTECA